MQHIELSAQEIESLREVIESRLAQLEVEIDRTDTHDFKEMLKHKRTLLQQVLAKLATASVAA
jgi:hypothetical protein